MSTNYKAKFQELVDEFLEDSYTEDEAQRLASIELGEYFADKADWAYDRWKDSQLRRNLPSPGASARARPGPKA